MSKERQNKESAVLHEVPFPFDHRSVRIKKLFCV